MALKCENFVVFEGIINGPIHVRNDVWGVAANKFMASTYDMAMIDYVKCGFKNINSARSGLNSIIERNMLDDYLKVKMKAGNIFVIKINKERVV